MRRLYQLSLLIILILFSLPARTELVEKIVAVVGSDIITLYDLDRAMASYAGEINRSVNKEQKFKSVKMEVLDRLINETLLRQAVKNANITVSNDDIARAIKNILQQSHATLDILKAELASKGISYESYKEDLKKNIERMKFLNQEVGSRIKISDQDMKDYYQKHLSEFGVHQSAHIEQIALPFDENITKEKAFDLQAKAKGIVSQTRGGAPFANFMKEYGGSDLGVVEPSKLSPEVSRELEKMKPGQVSDPILSPNGILIIHLVDRAQATEGDFEKMRDQIYEKMYEQRLNEEMDQYLTELRRKTFIEVR